MNKSDKEFLKALESVRDNAPRLADIEAKKNGQPSMPECKTKDIPDLLGHYKNDIGFVQVTPTFKIRNCWEAVDYAIRKFKKSFTNFDQLGLPSSCWQKESCSWSQRKRNTEPRSTVKFRHNPKPNDSILGGLF